MTSSATNIQTFHIRKAEQLLFDFAPADGLNEMSALKMALPYLDDAKIFTELSMAERATIIQARNARRPPPTTTPSEAPFTQLLADCRPVGEKKKLGQFFTPWPIVETMVEWVARHEVCNIVDAGCGTGRFAVMAAEKLPHARVLAIDKDPLASLMCRALVEKRGLKNVNVVCGDFLRADTSFPEGRTAFIGNPPYVRHHALSPQDKEWARGTAQKLGVPFSKLSGLHVYFLLAIAQRVRDGDIGCLITSAEWLDVNYGKTVRTLLADKLGLISVSLLDASCSAFADAMTSAAITTFEVGRKGAATFSSVTNFSRLFGTKDTVLSSPPSPNQPWGSLFHTSRKSDVPGLRLGDVFHVHRGIATGANNFFVFKSMADIPHGLESLCAPVIAKGRHILDAKGRIEAAKLPRILIPPPDLSQLPTGVRNHLESYLETGFRQGVASRYICTHRRPWWHLGLKSPPPIVVSYMARRAPAFAINPDGAHLINIGHGLYPKMPLSDRCLTFMGRSPERRFRNIYRAGAQLPGRIGKI